MRAGGASRPAPESGREVGREPPQALQPPSSLIPRRSRTVSSLFWKPTLVLEVPQRRLYIPRGVIFIMNYLIAQWKAFHVFGI